MIDLDPRSESFVDVVSYPQATGRDSVERSETEQKVVVNSNNSNEVVMKQQRRRFSASEKLRKLNVDAKGNFVVA